MEEDLAADAELLGLKRKAKPAADAAAAGTSSGGEAGGPSAADGAGAASTSGAADDELVSMGFMVLVVCCPTLLLSFPSSSLPVSALFCGHCTFPGLLWPLHISRLCSHSSWCTWGVADVQRQTLNRALPAVMSMAYALQYHGAHGVCHSRTLSPNTPPACITLVHAPPLLPPAAATSSS